jgi:hypothetical protein
MSVFSPFGGRNDHFAGSYSRTVIRVVEASRSPAFGGHLSDIRRPHNRPDHVGRFLRKVDFYDTKTGTTVGSSTSVTRSGSTVTVPLPGFQDDIAFKLSS